MEKQILNVEECAELLGVNKYTSTARLRIVSQNLTHQKYWLEKLASYIFLEIQY